MAAVMEAIVSALLCVMGWLQFRASVAVLRRSQQEFVRNLRWIRKVSRARPSRTTQWYRQLLEDR